MNATRILLLLSGMLPVGRIVCQPIHVFEEYHLLRSIAQADGKAKHFAVVYLKTLQQIELQLAGKDSAEREFTRKFELAFVRYFTDECVRYSRGDTVGSVWQSYFYGPDKNELEYQLTGVNAHINGDLWKAMAAHCSKTEIELNADCFITYQRSIKIVFNRFFAEALRNNKKLRFYNTVTFGLDKNIARHLLRKWRVRQEKLSLLYFNDYPGFEKKLRRLNKKRNGIDKRIVSFF